MTKVNETEYRGHYRGISYKITQCTDSGNPNYLLWVCRYDGKKGDWVETPKETEEAAKEYIDAAEQELSDNMAEFANHS